MKQLSILTSLAVLAAATACTVKEQEEVLPVIPQYEEFYATIEQPSETETKTYADDLFRVLWHADDRITIFNKYTYNQQYAFLGETGDNAGGFSKVGDDDFVTGNDLSDIYAVYPYQKGTKISNDGVITVSLPAEQTWADGSFGPGSNTMISATSDNKLKFRNTGSILVFKLYGSNVQVSTITLQGNNSERIAGKATVTMPVGGTPSVAMQSDATQSITLNCATPVTIGTSAGSYTEFWFVVPPTDFTRGFTITVTCADGGTFEKSTEKSVSLARNHIYRMAPIEVVPQKPAAVPEYVDLGLSAKWATFNLGATKPEEYGDYFAWGETEPKTDYSWATYKFELGSGNNGPFSKYVNNLGYGTVDHKVVLDPCDDAAHAIWGGAWRIPTDDEWTELRENCTWTWTDNYNGTGVAGDIVTSNKPGYSNKSIFFAAAGCRQGTKLNSVGSYGAYWSSSLYLASPDISYRLYFNYSRVSRSNYGRHFGFSVRPVYGEIVPVSSISIPETTTLPVGKSEILTATVLPADATYKTVTWSSSDESVATVDATGKVTAVATGKATITAYSADASKTASCEVTVVETAKPEAVDLGLPSGLKWATFNVGATKPEAYGDYFSWGETEPKSNYGWAMYKWYNGSNKQYSKYCTQSSYWGGTGPMDNKAVLDLEDDAAHASWGGSWRMPTEAEWYELITNCTWTWTSDYNGTGVKGQIVSASNGNSIFLPAAGSMSAILSYAGTFGYYWASSLSTYESGLSWIVQFNSDEAAQNYYQRFYGMSVRPVYGEFIPVSSISLDKTSLELYLGKEGQLTATTSPSNATEQMIHWASSDDSVAYVNYNGVVTALAPGTATITAYGSSGVSATCLVTVKSDLSLPASVEAVDLGLPSGLKWATMNVGATKPEEYGAYFAWGETQPKTDYSWSTYKFWVSGDGWDDVQRKFNVTLSKYNTKSEFGPVDNKTILDPEDDAAHVNWGGSWRMPTLEECDELINKCTWTWTTQNGVKGGLVTGPNGKSIFLPAAGNRYGSSLLNVGTYSVYWSSSLDTGGPYDARPVSFDSDGYDRDRSYSNRSIGFPVRPVTE